jgi:hypothetical protein
MDSLRRDFPKGPMAAGDWNSIKGKMTELCRALSSAAAPVVPPRKK